MKSKIKFIILIVIILGTLLALKFTPLKNLTDRHYVFDLLGVIKGHWWSGLVFVLVYGALGAIGFPGLVPTLVGGAIFGVFWGTIYNVVASNINAGVGFFVSRFFGKEFIDEKSKGKFGQLKAKIETEGFWVILYLRLIPLFPFNWINIACGLTKVKYSTYLVASVIGMLPGTIIYTYFADSLMQTTVSGNKVYKHAIIASSLFVLLSLVPLFIKIVRQRKATTNESPS